MKSKKSDAITKEDLNKINTDEFIEDEMNPIIDLFWKRFNERYFYQIEELEKSSKKEIRTRCGFIMTSIDCILIETLEQFYAGTDESKVKTQKVYQTFFDRDENLKKVIKTQKDAGMFAGFVRSGLLHQSKTKSETKINIKKSTPILEWIDSENKTKGFLINRSLFHKHVRQEFENYINKLKSKEEKKLRKGFIDKMKTLV